MLSWTHFSTRPDLNKSKNKMTKQKPNTNLDDNRRMLAEAIRRNELFYRPTYNWAALIMDILIMRMAVGVSIWQSNPYYLWLLIMTAFTGSYKK